MRCFGDSHARIVQIEALKNIPGELKHHFEAYSYSISAKLMYSVGRDGLNITELLKKPHRASIDPISYDRLKYKFNLTVPGYTSQFLTEAPEISEKDILYFVWGEIDVRHKIAEVMDKAGRTNLYEEINNVVDKYIYAIETAIEKIPAKTIWISGLHPQPKISNTNLITGTFERRWLHVLLVNRRLRKHCDQKGYTFIDFIDGYSLPDGDLDMSMSDGFHHLNFWTEETKNILKEKFLDHLNKHCHSSQSL